MDLVQDGYKFLSQQHLEAYLAVKELVSEEDIRQGREARRLFKDWERLPGPERREKEDLMCRDFIACREPYVKILTDILALASPVVVIPAEPTT